MSPQWQKEFFSQRIVLDLWQQARPPEHTRAEADFIERHLGTRKRLLDVQCGHGRHALELARRGCKIVGVDISPLFLEQAKANRFPEVEFHQGDVRQLRFDSEFDGAYCWGNCFGYFDYEGMQQFVGGVARALKPGGRFLIETGMVAESILPNMRERNWYQMGDILFAIENRYLIESSTVETEATFVRNGKLEKHTWWHVVFTVAELRRLLSEAGLEIRKLLGSLDDQPYRYTNPLLLLIAEKTC